MPMQRLHAHTLAAEPRRPAAELQRLAGEAFRTLKDIPTPAGEVDPQVGTHCGSAPP